MCNDSLALCWRQGIVLVSNESCVQRCEVLSREWRSPLNITANALPTDVDRGLENNLAGSECRWFNNAMLPMYVEPYPGL